jgi:hypothetical protein
MRFQGLTYVSLPVIPQLMLVPACYLRHDVSKSHWTPYAAQDLTAIMVCTFLYTGSKGTHGNDSSTIASVRDAFVLTG